MRHRGDRRTGRAARHSGHRGLCPFVRCHRLRETNRVVRTRRLLQFRDEQAAEYLGRLYPREERKTRIQVSAGRVTACLRSAWDLNRLLGYSDEKNRNDHRHHLVDAVVVALTTPWIVKELTRAAERGRRPGTFGEMWMPAKLHEEMQRVLSTVLVSHRVDRHVNGPLHEETFYGIVQQKGKPVVVVRKRIDNLTRNEVENILDPVIRRLVQQTVGDSDPKKILSQPQNWPIFETRTGKRFRIRRVRIHVDAKVSELVPGDPRRRVKTGGNHHLEVFETKDKKGVPRWKAVIVSRLEAMRRARAGQPVVHRCDGEGNKLLFSLAIGDAVQLDWKGTSVMAVVQKLSQNEYVFRKHDDGRMATKVPESEKMRISSGVGLQKCNCIKLAVDPLGRYHVAHD